MTEVPNIRSYFSISGFLCDPEFISNKLGVEPSQAAKKGESIDTFFGKPTEKFEVKSGFWRIDSEMPHSYILEDYVKDLISVIKKFAEKLAPLLEELEEKKLVDEEGFEVQGIRFNDGFVMQIMLAISINPNASYPGMFLGEEELTFLSKYKISLQLDVN